MNPHPIDDDDVARLVREVADGWVMPPVRLDQPSWRDRIRSPRERRAASVKGWLGRLGQAATAAVVLTVAAALIAVYLIAPRTDVGRSPNPSGQAPTPTPGAIASPLPKLFLNGELPSPATVVVQVADMNFAFVDLASGSLGSPLTASTWGSRVHHAPSGDLVCLCISADGYAEGNYTHMTVSLERFDATRRVVARTVVVDVTGQPDPRGPTADQTGHVSAATTFSTDGRYAYVGWSARAHPNWTSGIVVVDLDTAAIVQRLSLPDKADSSGDSRTYVDAPRVVGTAGGKVVIDRNGYTFAPTTANSYHTSSDVYLADVSAGSLGEPVALELGTGCGNDVTLAGGLADGGLWLSCVTYGTTGLNVIRRLKPDLSLAGDSTIASTAAAVDGTTSVVSSDGAYLYAWDPLALTLTRVELATGTTLRTQVPKPAAAADPLTALGHWLAPSAAAKSILQAGIAMSPDGRRIYALGINGDPAGDGFAGSAGVLVFDADTLSSLGRWAPTADFDSIAVSADGAVVYAAGAPDVDASGKQTNQQASITVFDATDGTIRLIAGQLGRATVTFPSTTLE